MDPVSDMFIRIKNAQKAGHESVQIPYSQFKHEIVKVFERAGLVKKVERVGRRVKKMLEITLDYDEDERPRIRDVKLISKPSRRLYISYKNLWKPRQGGIVILTTPRGVMTSSEAKKAKVGGQLIAEIW